MARISLQPAYVLHSRAYRESSNLLEVLTRDHGRIGIVARGSRSSRSRWRNVLQPFRPLLMSWSQRGDLGTLTGADQVAAPPPLQGDALYCGLYLNELLIRLMLRHDPHPDVFEQYQSTLLQLAQGSALQRSLRLFERGLLDATGFGLILDKEAGTGEMLRKEAWYEYHADRGPVRVNERNRAQPGVVSGKALLSLAAGNPGDEDLLALRTLMRRVIRHHLGDKPLASEALYRAMKPRRVNELSEQDQK